jgi:hypothetical protein
MGDLVSNHPWWIVAAVVTPFAVATWVIAGAHLMEARHGRHVFGDRG